MTTPSSARTKFIIALLHGHPRTTLACLALLSRLIPLILLHLLALLHLPHFDSSAQLISSNSATIRWDGVHFLAIAREGYTYEQQIAFQPGWPLLLRLTSWLVGFLMGSKGGVNEMERDEEVLSCTSYVGATVMLYNLTSTLFTPQYAWLTCLLYLFAPAPAVLSSGYSEPIFALLTFTGFYLAVKRKWWIAAIFLAGATAVRATGILAVGVLAWLKVFEGDAPGVILRKPWALLKRAFSCILNAIIIISPFALSQAYFYHVLCTGINATTTKAWCHKRIPLAYSHVQEKYWNVGLFNYWTPAQLPNILLASPVLLVSLIGSYRFFHSYLRHLSSRMTPTSSAARPGRDLVTDLSNQPRPFPPHTSNINLLLPFQIHSLALTFLLLFSAHTQIALRVCSTDSVLWWSLAGLAFDWKRKVDKAEIKAGVGTKEMELERTRNGGMTRLGRIWVWWVVIWGSISIVLWAGHYPPA